MYFHTFNILKHFLYSDKQYFSGLVGLLKTCRTGNVLAAWSLVLMGRSYTCRFMTTTRTDVRVTVTRRNEVGRLRDVCQGNVWDLQKTHPVWLSALQVVSAEGEELPWVIVLQPEHTVTGPLTVWCDMLRAEMSHKSFQKKFHDFLLVWTASFCLRLIWLLKRGGPCNTLSIMCRCSLCVCVCMCREWGGVKHRWFCWGRPAASTWTWTGESMPL